MSLVIDASGYLNPGAPDAGLQRAIDAVPMGGTLSLPAGRFLLRRRLVLKSNMTLIGAGPETVLTIAPGPPCAALAADSAPEAVSLEVADARGFAPGMEVTIRDRQQTGWNAGFALVAGVEGRRLYLDRALERGYCVAEEAQVVHAFPAIAAGDACNVSVRHLRVLGEGPIPGLIPHNLFVQSAIHFVGCRDPLIAFCAVERWHADGFSVQKSSGTRVMENLARHNIGHGFHPGTGLKDAVWSGNVSEWNARDGLYYCAGCRRVIAGRNRFAGNSGHGIGGLGDGDDQDCLAIRNLCERNDGAGVCTGCHGGESRNNFIVENRIINNAQLLPGTGILLQCSHANVVARNEIADTQSPREAPTQTVGVEEADDGSDGNWIVANEIAGAQREIVARGPDTLVETAFPGGIPAERLRLLEMLERREEEAWSAWQQERESLLPA